MSREPVDVIRVMVWAVAIAWTLVLCCGCVTRTTVCVEASRSLGRRDYAPEHYAATAGGSVCAEFERP